MTTAITGKHRYIHEKFTDLTKNRVTDVPTFLPSGEQVTVMRGMMVAMCAASAHEPETRLWTPEVNENAHDRCYLIEAEEDMVITGPAYVSTPRASTFNAQLKKRQAGFNLVGYAMDFFAFLVLSACVYFSPVAEWPVLIPIVGMMWCALIAVHAYLSIIKLGRPETEGDLTFPKPSKRVQTTDGQWVNIPAE